MIISNLPALDTSDTTALQSDVVQGKSFYNSNGELVSGSLVVPTYEVTSATPGDVASGKSFYSASSTSSVTKSTGTLYDFRGQDVGVDIGDGSVGFSGGVLKVQPAYSAIICGQAEDVYGITVPQGYLSFALGLATTPVGGGSSSIIASGQTFLGVTGTGGSTPQQYYIELANGYGNTSYCYVQKNGTTQTSSFYAETGDTLRFYVGSGTKAVYYNGTSQTLTSNAWTMTVGDSYGDLRILFDYVSGTRSIIRISNNEYVYTQNKTVTSNGTVTADNGYDGLGTVTVAIPLYDKSFQ